MKGLNLVLISRYLIVMFCLHVLGLGSETSMFSNHRCFKRKGSNGKLFDEPNIVSSVFLPLKNCLESINDFTWLTSVKGNKLKKKYIYIAFISKSHKT